MRKVARSLALAFAALALLLQANAPVQAAMMAAGSDLPANLCVSHAPGQNHQSPNDRDNACAACAVCVAGATTAILADAALIPRPASVAFIPEALHGWISIRGPPARSANARAPPILA